jgi:hypothetical protein
VYQHNKQALRKASNIGCGVRRAFCLINMPGKIKKDPMGNPAKSIFTFRNYNA